MKALLITSSHGPHHSRFLPLVVLVAPFLMLAGCSYVPNALNPVEWYKDAAGWFGDDEEGEVTETGPGSGDVKTTRASDMVPGTDKDFPKLSSVPDAPLKGTRQKIADSLAADTADRRYSDEVAPPAPKARAVTPPSPPSPPSVAGDRVLPPPPMPEPGGPPVAAPRESVKGESVAGAPGAGKTVARVMEKNETAPGPLEKFDASRAVVSARVGLIEFGNGSAGLSSADRRQLKKIADSQKKNGGTLRVIGFASSWTGNMDPLKHQLVNFDVSLRRANSVAGALINYGVTAKDLYVGAKSDAEPIYLEVMPAGEAGNRRVEVYLDY